MGDIADSIVEGEICQICCAPDGREPQGYPYTCAECGGDDAPDDDDPSIFDIKPRPTSPKVPCSVCGKMIHEIGMHQHVAAKHPEE